MPIYETHRECKRIIYLSPHSGNNISSITVVSNQEGFDDTIYGFAYSLDNSTWSEWLTLNELLSAISIIEFPNINIYLKIKIDIRKSTKTQEHAYWSLNEVKINEYLAKVTNISIVEDSNILINTNSKNLFQPYRNSEYQKELFAKFSKSVSDIFSFECIYFRVEPQEDSKDVTFKTYKLANVVESKPLAIVINNNDIPYDRLLFSNFDVDFQDELEIHIVKEVFWNVFGYQTKPDARDFMFLPLTNRMYEVNTSGNGELFFNDSPYWKAFLVKYENRSTTVKDDAIIDELDDLVEWVDDYESEQYSQEKENSVLSYTNEAIESVKNISNDELTFNDVEIFKWSFNYEDILNTEIAKEYEFKLDTTEFSMLMWIQLNNASKIFELKNIDEHTIYTLSGSSSGFIAEMNVELNKLEIASVSMTEPVQLIDTSQWLGIVINYINIGASKLTTISIYNTKLELIHEVAESNPLDMSIPYKLKILGGTSFSNVRMKRKFVKKSDAKQELTNNLPLNTEDFVVIDNATPKFITQE